MCWLSENVNKLNGVCVVLLEAKSWNENSSLTIQTSNAGHGVTEIFRMLLKPQ